MSKFSKCVMTYQGHDYVTQNKYNSEASAEHIERLLLGQPLLGPTFKAFVTEPNGPNNRFNDQNSKRKGNQRC